MVTCKHFRCIKIQVCCRPSGRGEDFMMEFWNRPPLAMACHYVHSLTLILGAFIILWNNTRGDARDPGSICHSTREARSRATANSSYICLTVSAGTFIFHHLSGLFYMEIVIFGFCFICMSGFSIFRLYICIVTGCRVKYAWLTIRNEGLCRVFVPDLAFKSQRPAIAT